MSPFADLLPPALLRALGFTLLHSLWQGTLVALLAAGLLLLLPRHAAVVRYRVAAGALLALVALAGFTFGQCYSAGFGSLAPAAVAGRGTGGLVSGLLAGAVPPAPAGLRHLLDAGSGNAERHLPLLVGTWLLGTAAMLLRLLSGLAYVQRLRSSRVAALPVAWQEWLDGLARRAGLKQRVQVLASALVTSPAVVGWWRPVVLLPLGLATGLPAPELEMILAHELAHVLRRDYLFNLLQSVAEILFFYHPAVWFLSASLRTERENCCDDVAIRLHGDARLLAQALAAVAELRYAAARPQLVLAAAGSAGSLLGRVRRLVQQAPAASTFAEGFGAAAVAITGLVLLAGSTVAALGEATSPTEPLGKPLQAYLSVASAPVFGALEPGTKPTVLRLRAVAHQRPSAPPHLPASVDGQQARAVADYALAKRLRALSPLTARLSPLVPSSTRLAPLARRRADSAAGEKRPAARL